MRSKQDTVTAVIVGAGAVENCWDPILRAVQRHWDFPLTIDGANCFLARLVYLLRWYASDPSELGPKALKEHRAFLNVIKKDICHELRRSQAQAEMRVRDEFEAVLDTTLFRYSSTFMLVSTNWDTVFCDALSRYANRTMDGVLRPLHVHGSVANPHTLYLPTEITKEPYRSRSEEQQIGGIHGRIWRGLEDAHRVVIYGLSLSPLDAELSQTLAAGFDNDVLEDVIVVTPEHALVAHRVNLLLHPKRHVRVTGFEPSRLKAPYDYTILRPPTPEGAK